MSHRCHAHACYTQVPPRMFMCRRHWSKLRPQVRAAVWREYRSGQERDKRPSDRYLAVASLAIAELVFVPHSETAAREALPYLDRALRARARAIDTGHGDPLDGLISEDE